MQHLFAPTLSAFVTTTNHKTKFLLQNNHYRYNRYRFLYQQQQQFHTPQFHNPPLLPSWLPGGFPVLNFPPKTRPGNMSNLPPPPPMPPPPGSSGSGNPNTLYGKITRVLGIYARMPSTHIIAGVGLALLYPPTRILHKNYYNFPYLYANRAPPLPHPYALPIFASIFFASSLAPISGYSRDGAGILSAWSMVYLLINAKSWNRMYVRQVGGPMRLVVAGNMLLNAVAGTGVFLFNWGGGSGGSGGWKMRMPWPENVQKI